MIQPPAGNCRGFCFAGRAANACAHDTKATSARTGTCIKLRGHLRVDATFNGGAEGQPAWDGEH
jgi:hypothetical protein